MYQKLPKLSSKRFSSVLVFLLSTEALSTVTINILFWNKKIFQIEVFTISQFHKCSREPKAKNYQTSACLVSCPATAGCQLKHYQHSDYDLCGWAPSPPPQVWLLHNPLWNINISIRSSMTEGGFVKHGYLTLHKFITFRWNAYWAPSPHI